MERRNYRPPMINLPNGVSMLADVPDYTSTCPHCHQQTILRPIKLSKAMIKPLLLANRKISRTITPKEVHDECGRTAYANYTALKHWGFLTKIEVDGKERWKMTDLGHLFIAGAIAVPETLWIYNDRPRIVPDEMLGTYVSIAELVEYIEITRESAAADSLPLDVQQQEKLIE